MGVDDDGNSIEFEYTLGREAKGGGRVRDPCETLACDVRELKINSRGDYVIDFAGRSKLYREPTVQELNHITAHIGGGGKHGALWSKRQLIQGQESSSECGDRSDDAIEGEKKPLRPYCPPGHVLIPIVSPVHVVAILTGSIHVQSNFSRRSTED